MPSRRMIYPSFWRSESMAMLTERQRLLFIGIISNADDQGRLSAHPGLIRSDVFPYDDEALEDIEQDLQAIATTDSIFLYAVAGKALLQIINWWKYQHLRWAHPSAFSAPEGWGDRWCFWDGKKAIFKNWPHSDKPNWWKKLRRRILKRDNGICRYCGARAEHIDHVVPRCQGGSDDESNLVAACAHCNTSKGGRTPEEAGMILRRRQNATLEKNPHKDS